MAMIKRGDTIECPDCGFPRAEVEAVEKHSPHGRGSEVLFTDWYCRQCDEHSMHEQAEQPDDCSLCLRELEEAEA